MHFLKKEYLKEQDYSSEFIGLNDKNINISDIILGISKIHDIIIIFAGL